MPLKPQTKDKLWSTAKAALKASIGAAIPVVSAGLAGMDLSEFGPIGGPAAMVASQVLVQLLSKFTVDK